LRTDRDPRRSAVFVVDLDHFKLVNDGLGHEAGDELLRKVAPRLAGAIRRQDTLARLGGDEFAVLCEQIPSEAAATRIASKMASALEEPIGLGGDEHVISASIGIAISSPGYCAANLLRDADSAMFQAKQAGRGGFYFATPVAPEAFAALLGGGPPSWAHLFAEPAAPVRDASRSRRIPSSV
jgi:diguanylate cyclase (GGDEF)-like protein